MIALRKIAEKDYARTLWLSLAGVAIPIVAPYIHFGFIYSHWTPYKMIIDKDTCQCTCWDTLFKGSYQEMNPGYKHVYFNITRNSFIIWTLTILAIIAVYEATKFVIHLQCQGILRTSMFILLVASLYPNYYSWWSYFNAWNDEYYGQFIHQGIFTMTELVSTFTIVYLCNTKHTVEPILLLVILNIAILHILASCFDQFITNVLGGEGEWHQLWRDLGFMVFDVFNLIIPMIEMRNYAYNHGIHINQCLTFDELVCSVIFIALLLFVIALV